MKQILLLVLLIIAGFCQTPHDILEVQPKSLSADWRSAMKIQGLKFHPDRLDEPMDRESDISLLPHQRVEKFIQIANAYQQLQGQNVLSSDQIDLNKKSFNFEKYEEFFYQFFEENGQVCHISGEERICEGGPSEDYPENAFFESKTLNLNMKSIGAYFKKTTVWLVVCIKDSIKYKKDDTMMKTWRKVGNKNKDFMSAGGVDCKVEKEICEEVFDVKDKDLESFAITPDGTFKSLTGYVTSVQNIQQMGMNKINEVEVDELYVQNYQVVTAKTGKDNKKLAVFFSEKNNVPKTFKLIASKFQPWYRFSAVSSVNTNMVEKFGIKEFPALLVLTDPMNSASVETFQGEFKKEQIGEFLKQFRRPEDNSFKPYTPEKQEDENFCGKQDSKFCLILNLEGDNTLLEKVQQVPEKFVKMPVRFFYAEKAFSEELEGQQGFVMVKSKRQRYAISKASERDLTDFVQATFDGTLNFIPIPDKQNFQQRKEEL